MPNKFFRDKGTFFQSLLTGVVLPRKRIRQTPERKKVKFSQRVRARRIRKKMLEAYGGCCVCCGETYESFLTIDHIFRDGNIERKTIGSGIAFYRHLEKLGYPRDRYRLLCMNCNFVQRYGDPCPHEVERKMKRKMASRIVTVA